MESKGEEMNREENSYVLAPSMERLTFVLNFPFHKRVFRFLMIYLTDYEMRPNVFINMPLSSLRWKNWRSSSKGGRNPKRRQPKR